MEDVDTHVWIPVVPFCTFYCLQLHWFIVDLVSGSVCYNCISLCEMCRKKRLKCDMSPSQYQVLQC